ncbi:MAG TPA: dTMP kinase [Patescibacteria group bacterium]|uniref:Thymidylate kinase n=1 Tax=Candidatus Woesebacteria bacterium RBG_13_46_13 TaxID=1802479 RepID=A0A1F7X4Q3_9BACT|nr:MAG: dTMP kinase [Candidatus Woesebacteria bacterium RBG_13_46_13]HJX59464.1 dTMP kinase [Patescibacteria group bacterium]
MRSGYFITLEGGEGSGKSSVGEVLYLYLQKLGLPVRFLREPGGTEVGEKIRDILKDKSLSSMSIKTELLLFEAARAQIVEEIIRPGLVEGKIMILDRYGDSSVAYQGFARDLGTAWVKGLNHWTTDNLQPDLTLLFDIDPEIALTRKKQRENDRLDSLELEFHRKVRIGYLDLSRAETSEGRRRWCIVDASQPLEEVTGVTLSVVREKLIVAGFIEAPNIRKEARG